MKIFLLEDDPIYQDLLLNDLKGQKHEVVPHDCVQGAADTIKKGGFDLLIIDIVLPETGEMIGKEIQDGGIHILEDLRDNPDYIMPITLFISAYGVEDNSDRIERLHLNQLLPTEVQTYFRKPYSFDALWQAIKQIERLTGRR